MDNHTKHPFGVVVVVQKSRFKPGSHLCRNKNKHKHKNLNNKGKDKGTSADMSLFHLITHLPIWFSLSFPLLFKFLILVLVLTSQV